MDFLTPASPTPTLKVAPGETVRAEFHSEKYWQARGRRSSRGLCFVAAERGEPPKRLVGWSRVRLNPGESKDVTVEVEPLFLSIFNVEQKGWQRVPGDYTFMVGGSSQNLPLKAAASLN